MPDVPVAPAPPPAITNAPADPGRGFFGARGKARELAGEVEQRNAELHALRADMQRLGILSAVELEQHRERVRRETAEQVAEGQRLLSELARQQSEAAVRLAQTRQQIVVTEETALLQEAGVYQYQHPLSDAVAYQAALAVLQERIKAMARADGGAVQAAQGWTVNGSEAQGRTNEAYHRVRIQELQLTADYVQKVAEEKEREREEKARLREERKVQQEIERERARLDKERAHYLNALAALQAKGDADGAAQLQERLAQIDTAIQDVDYRAANIRAGYVYVISNIGAFGESMIKVGLTRRLDPMDRVRELSDASVPFNFDVHALFFSENAVGIEAAMHARLADRRVNRVNHRREFFHATPAEAKTLLADLAGNLLQYEEVPQALEFRQSLTQAQQ
ncbi:GIY-YIG nuclease family protein [Actinoplanes philippinensis]|uniref:GIY-YIG nuclease family protein n=1 Tax=Actinoplanes philippinensis TaxID=35752 RepID=UPI001EF21089|nr:GIY-YIG nuclease family protein [Actinoplanes philippinensis]